MSCLELCRKGLRKEWLDSEEGKTKVIKTILRDLGYGNVHSTEPIPGEDARLIGGDHKVDKSTYGVSVIYTGKGKGERIEISSIERDRAEAIEESIRAVFPHLEISLRNSSPSGNRNQYT